MTRNLGGLSIGLGIILIGVSGPAIANTDDSAESGRTSSQVTADQQSQKKPDVEISRKIRQELLKDDSLSSDAHNVKIITREGKVTLKGPVKSESEKNRVELQARNVVGSDKVKSDLKVTQ